MKAQPTAARWPVYLVILLLAGLSILFVILFFDASVPPAGAPVESITAQSYLDIVEPLLANAQPENGEALLVRYDCAACHIIGAANGIAPAFDGLAEEAALRRPPLTAAAYIYESILYPDVFELDGYGGVMPQNFASRLSEQELGDMIAYLLTFNVN